MKRARSALTLKNMAESIQQSIQQTVKLQLARQTGHTRSTMQLPNGIAQERALSKQQKDNRIFILEKQIACMERQLQNSKSTIRNYSKQLDDYELLTGHLTNTQQAISQKQEQLQRLRNQMLMLQEERQSIWFNTQQRIAEKQYYEELIDTYKAQYESQSKILMAILELEDSNKKINQEIQQIKTKIEINKQELEKWRKETDFDLNQHKIKNTIKIIRMELIACQDKCDAFCQQHGLRKLRELYCLFFKHYAKRNGIANEQAEGGIDLFICKQGVVEEFSEFVQERLVYNKPHCQSIEEYLLGLTKMESILKKSNSQMNNKLYNVQLEQIKQFQAQADNKQSLVKNNQQKIVELQSKIDQQFGHDSLAVIQYLRERSNKYDIQEIKATLKEHKKQQQVRIKKIREACSALVHLEQVLANDDSSHKIQVIRQTLYELQEEAFSIQTELQKLQHDLEHINIEKGNLESLINGAISKWRERDQNKVKLKQLYLQLAQAKKSYPKASTYDRSISFKQLRNTKKQPVKQSAPSQYALTDSRKTAQHSKNSSIVSLNQSKSILSLSNPYEKIMKRQIQQYQPIISDCRMIFSKKLPSRQESKELLLAREEPKGLTIRELKQSRADSTNMKKTKNISQKTKGKENSLWDTRTKCQSQSQAKYSLSIKPSAPISIQASKGKMTSSERASLSQLLINKFNR